MIPKIPNDLLDAIVEQRCVPFFGAGISVPSGLPTASQFLEGKNIGLNFGAGAQLMKQERRLLRAFHDTFNNHEAKPNHLHKLLVHLDAKYYITTNYDMLFERAFEGICHERNASHDSEPRLLTVNCDQRLAGFLKAEKAIIKIHGDVEKMDYLVMTSEQYRDRLRSPKLVDNIVQLLLMNYTVLFLGSTLSDDNILELLSSCYHPENGPISKKYLFTDSPNGDTAKLLEGTYGVETIHLAKDELPDWLNWMRKKKDLSDFSFFTLVPDFSPCDARTIIQTVTRLKQQNKIAEALLLIEKHSDDLAHLDWAFNGGNLNGWIYCTLGVYDKNEDWHTLEHFNKRVLVPLLNRVEKVSAPQLCRQVWDRYSRALIVSECRYLKFEDALQREMPREPDSTADDEEKIAYADFCTLKAVAFLAKHTFRRDQAKESLDAASQYLEKARATFDECVSKESHYKGRMYGMELFLHFAAVRANISEYRQSNPLECAWRGPKSKDVTGYGRIAGLYCVAYCCFMLAKESDDENMQKNLRKESLKWIEKALEDDNIQSGRPLTRFKFELLRSRILDRAENGDRSGGAANASEIERVLRMNAGHGFSCEKWLNLPLN